MYFITGDRTAENTPGVEHVPRKTSTKSGVVKIDVTIMHSEMKK